jgi:23S rRNA (uridine2552-2'-O)-methyltransferase
VRFIQGDCRSESVRGELEAALEGRAVDLVLSDMAPNISGIAAMDQARSRELVELAADLAIRLLAPNGILLVKVFQGAELPGLRADLSARFRTVALRKPRASRAESSELYLLARGPGV